MHSVDKNTQASEFESLSAGLIMSEHNFGLNLEANSDESTTT